MWTYNRRPIEFTNDPKRSARALALEIALVVSALYDPDKPNAELPLLSGGELLGELRELFPGAARETPNNGGIGVGLAAEA